MQPCNTPHILVMRLVETCEIALTSLSIDRMVVIALIYGETAALNRASTMRLIAAPGVDIVALVLLLSCYNNPITSVRQSLLIGKVDNDVIELWVSNSNTCTVAGRPSRQKVGTLCFKWKVETCICTREWVCRSFSLYILIGKSIIILS